MELRQPTVALSAWIPEQIAAYATDPTSYMERIAARNGVLPLYLDWGMDFDCARMGLSRDSRRAVKRLTGSCQCDLGTTIH